METVDDVIAHFGIKGMRWGVRRREGPGGTVGEVHNVGLSTDRHGKVQKTSGGSNRPTSEDVKSALVSRQVATASGTHALSNKELQHLVNRMNLEQQYSRLISGEKGAVSKTLKKGYGAVKGLLGLGKTAAEVHSLANSQMMKDLKKHLNNKR